MSKSTWEDVEYRMDAEGFDYCFDGYSDWKDIDDERFHTLIQNYLEAKQELEDYVLSKLSVPDEEVDE